MGGHVQAGDAVAPEIGNAPADEKYTAGYERGIMWKCNPDRAAN